MNLFEKVKSAVSVMQMYGLEVKRLDMLCCLFHEDKRPSLKLNEEYFYCFGCGANGDVVTFVSRLFGLSQYETAKKLSYDFSIDTDKPDERLIPKPKRLPKMELSKAEQKCQLVLCDYLHLLEKWQKNYAPANQAAKPDERFVETCQMIDYVRYLADVFTFGAKERRIKALADLQRNNTVARLVERLKRMKGEVSEIGRTQEIA